MDEVAETVGCDREAVDWNRSGAWPLQSSAEHGVRDRTFPALVGCSLLRELDTPVSKFMLIAREATDSLLANLVASRLWAARGTGANEEFLGRNS